MHANVHADRNEWRLPPDETLQVADPKAKKAEVGDEEVSTFQQLRYELIQQIKKKLKKN